MTSQVELMGMVISSMPIGEFDKRLVILTDRRGKITAFSRGSRRPKSSMLGATEPGVFGKFILVEGRDSYTLVSAEISKYFMELRGDITKACLGFYCMEVAGYFSRENLEGTEVLNLLVATFNAICKEKVPARLIRRIFELKMLTLCGEYPNVYSCMKCGAKEPLTWFAPNLSGAVCHQCKRYASPALPMSGSALYAMQYVISSSIAKLYTFTVKDEVLDELESIVNRSIHNVAGINFKSEEMLMIL